MLRRVLSLGLALAVALILSSQVQAQGPLRGRGKRVAPPPAPAPIEQPVPPATRPVEPAPRPGVPATTPGVRPGAQANSHMGWFVKAEGNHKFVMRSRNGNEHTHTLARNATILCDGKSCKLSDLKKGEMLRVTTKPNDKNVVVRIDATRAANNRLRGGQGVNPLPPTRPLTPTTPPPAPAPVPPRRERR
jgi:hypothetical protein